MMQYYSILVLLLLLIGRPELSATQPSKEDSGISTPCKSGSPPLREETLLPSLPNVQAPAVVHSAQTAPLDISFLPQDDRSPQSGYWGISQSQADYLFAHSPDLVTIMEHNLMRRINSKWQECLGWHENELLNVELTFLMFPEDIQSNYAQIQLLQQRLFTSGYEGRIKCKDGSYRWFQWISLGTLEQLLESPKSQCFLCIGRDVTQKKEQEAARVKAIEESQQKIAALNISLQAKNQILEAISNIQSEYINEQGQFFQEEADKEFAGHYRPLENILQHFIDLSESEYGFIGELFYDDREQPFIQQIFGSRQTGEIGERLKQALDFYKQKGRRLCSFDNIVGEMLKTKKSLIINDLTTYPHRTGIPPNHIPIKSILGIPILVKDELVGMVALANKDKGYSDELLAWLDPLSFLAGRIMNELKLQKWRREAEKQQISCKQADAANEAKSAFLAHMSHEIRTPLTGILGTLELIRDDDLLEEDREHLKAAQMAGKSLMSLLNDVLDIAKIEAHQIGLEKVELNPTQIAQEVIQFLSFEIQKQKINLTLTITPEVPTHLIGDPLRFRQILSNLISNAVKFTEKGSVSVTLKGRVDPEAQVSFYLCGIVTDTGIGIKPESLSHLFQPFMQADNAIMRQFGGTGLGLYITKGLCELMGGSIEVMSQLGEGSTFQFKIKMEVPKALSSITTTNQIERSEKLSNVHILIAEDNLINQKVLKAMLQREGCSIEVAANGREALEAVQKEEYDIILMDGEMPVMDGLEATRKIRELFDNHDLPIIGITAHALATDRERFLGSGMNGYLTKPIQKQALKAEILRCLQEKSSY